MDDADIAAEHQAIADKVQSLRRERKEAAAKAVVSACVDCGSSLHPVRIGLGCARCVECQQAVEKAARFFRRSDDE